MSSDVATEVSGYDRYVSVSEDAIAFWGCMFPDAVQPTYVYRCLYAGSPTEILMFDYPSHLLNYNLRSVECWLTGSQINSKWSQECLTLTPDKKYKVYRMAWYGHDPSVIP